MLLQWRHHRAKMLFTIERKLLLLGPLGTVLCFCYYTNIMRCSSSSSGSKAIYVGIKQREVPAIARDLQKGKRTLKMCTLLLVTREYQKEFFHKRNLSFLRRKEELFCGVPAGFLINIPLPKLSKRGAFTFVLTLLRN